MNNLLQTPFSSIIYTTLRFIRPRHLSSSTTFRAFFVHDIYHPSTTLRIFMDDSPIWTFSSDHFFFPLSSPATTHLELSTTVCVLADSFIHSFEGLTLFTNCGAISLSSMWTTFRPLISRVWRSSRQNLSRSFS